MHMRYRRLAQAVSIFLGISFFSNLAVADTLNLTFESDEYGALPSNNEATSLYAAQGVVFPSRPKIVDDYTASPIRETVIVDGEERAVSRQPLALGVRGRDRCGELRIQFNSESDVRRVTMREVTYGVNTVGYEAFNATGERIDGDIASALRRPEPLRRDRRLEINAPVGAPGIVEILLQPTGICTEYLTIGDMTIESEGPLVPLDALPDLEIVSTYRAVEAQPTVPWSGRINDISIDPRNPLNILAAADTGGLFESTDGGVKWRAVASLPAFHLNAVHHHLANSEFIVVAARANWARRTVSGRFPSSTVETADGGVWISRDRGETWEQPIEAMPFRAALGPGICPTDGDAWEIDEDAETGRVFIATDCGVTYVDDLADSATTTWQHISPSVQTRGNIAAMRAVAYLGDSNVIAGGTSGLWYSRDNGEYWDRVDPQPGIGTYWFGEMHSLSGLPSRPGVGVATFNISGEPAQQVLAVTNDGGRNWARITPVLLGDGCGGFAFAYATDPDPSGSIARVYYGDKCNTFFVDVDVVRRLLVGARNQITADQYAPEQHADHRSLGFERRSDGSYRPDLRFLTGDGGVFRRIGGPADPLRLAAVGSGPDGLNALQVFEVNGQYVRDTDSFNLVFGTMDNKLWASSDEVRWPEEQAAPWEGLRVEMVRTIARQGVDTWTYLACADCDIWLSNPLLLNRRRWPSRTPDGQTRAYFAPLKLNLNTDDGVYAQTYRLNRDGAASRYFLTRTNNYGRSITGQIETTSINDEIRWVRRAGGLSLMSPRKNGTVNALRKGVSFDYDRVHLKFFPRVLTANTDPTMNGFGSIGMKGFTFDVSAVFAINPANPMDMIAPDVENNKVMRSDDGGANWTEMTELTRLVTGDGAIRFSRAANFLLSNVSAISYFPQDSTQILIGLQSGGAFITSDDGESWKFVEGSDKIPNISGFYWKNSDDIYVSSYGRGLWRIQKQSERRSLTELTAFLSRNNSGFLFGSVEMPENGIGLRPIGSRDRALRSFQAGMKEFGIDTIALVVDGEIEIVDAKQDAPLRDWLNTTGRASVYEFVNDIPKTSTASDTNELQPQMLKLPNSGTEIHNRLSSTGLSGRLQKNKMRRLNRLIANSGNIVGVALKSGEIVAAVEGGPLKHSVPQNVPDGPRQYPPGVAYPPSATFTIEGNLETIDFGPGVVDATRPVKLVGLNFPPEATLEISVNEELVDDATMVDANGGFFAEIMLPPISPGDHTVTVTAVLPGGNQETVRRGFYAKHFDGEETGGQ